MLAKDWFQIFSIISKDVIRKLSEHFSLSQETFNRPYTLKVNAKLKNARVSNQMLWTPKRKDWQLLFSYQPNVAPPLGLPETPKLVRDGLLAQSIGDGTKKPSPQWDGLC